MSVPGGFGAPVGTAQAAASAGDPSPIGNRAASLKTGPEELPYPGRQIEGGKVAGHVEQFQAKEWHYVADDDPRRACAAIPKAAPQPRSGDDDFRGETIRAGAASEIRSITAHLRQIGPAPQIRAPESGRNRRGFHTAASEIVWPTETLIRTGANRQRRWSKALVRHGADPALSLARALEVSAGDIRVSEGAGVRAYGQYGPQPSPQ